MQGVGKGENKTFKKLFLFVCFPGSPQPGTEKETQGVDEARRELQDVLSTLLSRSLRITEQHERHFAQLPSPTSLPTQPRALLPLRTLAEGAL